jgi:transposase InsO family protein
MSGRYPSTKLGRSVGFESRTLELPIAITLERSADVLAYFDQAPVITIRTRRRDGRRQSWTHRTDFLAVYRNGRTVLVEGKRLAAIAAKNEAFPDYYVAEDGRWRCPPAEEGAREFGIEYEVWTEEQFPSMELRNILFLDGYLKGNSKAFDGDIARLQDYLTSRGAVTLDAAVCDLEGEVSVDAIYAAIARGAVACDLRAAPLSHQSQCRVFRDESTLTAFTLVESRSINDRSLVAARTVDIAPGDEIVWSGAQWRCVSVSGNELLWSRGNTVQPMTFGAFVQLLRTGEISRTQGEAPSRVSGEVSRLLGAASQAHLEKANATMARISPYLDGKLKSPQSRTLRRYLERYREALALHGNGYVGLLPRYDGNANRPSRMHSKTLQITSKWVRERYLDPSRPSKKAVYALITYDCDQEGCPRPSYSWFCRVIDGMQRYERELARRGRRGAYTYEPRQIAEDGAAVPYAERAFQHTHIDHTEIDLVSLTDESGDATRLWLTALICSYTRRVLAFVLSVEPPSYRSVLRVFRECVKRHNRLPDTVVVDGGKELQCIWFETMCSLYHVNVIRRPCAKPRFGAEMERLFGTSNANLLHFLRGNTQNLRTPRTMVKATDPFRLAVWRTDALSSLVARYFYETYDQLTHSTLLRSPRDVFEESQHKFGMARHRYIENDELFHILTSATTRSGKAKVQPDGVVIGYLYYNASALQRHLGKSVPVRYDPFDLSVAWAQVDGAWTRIRSKHGALLVHYSEHQVLALTEQWRQRRGEVKRERLTDLTLVELLNDAMATEAQLVRDRTDVKPTTKPMTDAIRAGSAPSNRPAAETIFPDTPPISLAANCFTDTELLETFE